MNCFAWTFPFLHSSLALWAVAAGLLPILIHFINRRRYRQAPWAAMSFLLSANQRSRKRLQMEQWLLLLIRIALIVLLGLAVARPFVSAAPLGGLGSGRMHRVLILDNSISMLASADGKESRFATALGAADQLLGGLPDGDVVSVVTTAAPSEAVIEHPAGDRRVVRERVQGVTPLPKPADWIRAINLAREILKNSPLAIGNHAVHVISDFRQKDWLGDTAINPGGSSAPASPAAAALRRLADESGADAPGIHVIRVNDENGDNVGISDLVMESTLLTPRLPARAVVQVVNHSRATQRRLVLQFRRGGQVLRREQVPEISAGGSAMVAASLEFAGPGTHLLEVAMEGADRDVLKIDDTRFLSVEVREKVAALLVDGQPGATPLSGQAGYLAKALHPVSGSLDDLKRPAALGGEASLVEAKVISSAEFAGEVLGDYDVIALCDVARLSARQWEQLREVVARGTGFLVFGGDLLNVEHYNEFARADSAPLLPGTLSPSVPLGARPDAAGGFKLSERIHPIVAEFARFPDSGLFTARVDRYLPLTPNASGSEVVLRFSDGAPALAVGAHHLGRVAFMATTANMAWNTLPAKGDYVSLMLNITAFLAPQRGAQRNVLAGGTLREPINASESGLPLRVITSDGERHDPRLVAEQGMMFLTYGPIESVGPLVISVGAQQRAGCVNVDGRSLEMFTAEQGSLQAALGTAVTMSDARTGGGVTSRAKTTEIAKPLLMIVGLLLALEMWMAMHFGVRYISD